MAKFFPQIEELGVCSREDTREDWEDTKEDWEDFREDREDFKDILSVGI